ncbi:MAG: aspartyl protease family protein [Treponema sp.]|nr:aspartyl protease family protein [Treponema sp.]
MGEVNVEITLKNGADIILASNGHITDQDVRTATVTAVVDTGAMSLVIGEKLRSNLGLAVIGQRSVTLAGGVKSYCSVAEPVQIGWKNRTSLIRPWVLSDENEVLLGVIPLEEMDLMVDPVNNTLVGVHGDEIMGRIL